jgi:hypothetical protein
MQRHAVYVHHWQCVTLVAITRTWYASNSGAQIVPARKRRGCAPANFAEEGMLH